MLSLTSRDGSLSVKIRKYTHAESGMKCVTGKVFHTDLTNPNSKPMLIYYRWDLQADVIPEKRPSIKYAEWMLSDIITVGHFMHQYRYMVEHKVQYKALSVLFDIEKKLRVKENRQSDTTKIKEYARMLQYLRVGRWSPLYEYLG